MDTVYMTASAAADYVGLSESYLAKLRMDTGARTGPKYLRVGQRAIRYRRIDLDDWMLSKSVAHTTKGRLS
ncbi:MAG: helix-turn-helix transcriptional regulator [Yoonia sp.]